MPFFVLILMTLATSESIWGRDFVKTEWQQTFSYSNAKTETTTPSAALFHGTAIYGSDLKYCELTIKDDKIPCKVLPNEKNIYAYFKSEDYRELLKIFATVSSPEGQRALQITEAHLIAAELRAKADHRNHYEQILIHQEKEIPKIIRDTFNDPQSDFEAVQRLNKTKFLKRF